MSKTAKWILAIALLLLMTGSAFAVYAHRLLTSDFSIPMPAEGRMTLTPQEDSSLRLAWPEAEGAAGYRVEVRESSQEPALDPAPQLLYSLDCEGPSCLLPAALPKDREVELCVYARSHRTVLGQEQDSFSPEPRILHCSLRSPRADGLSVAADPETMTAVLSWSGTAGDEYSLYCRRGGGDAELLRSLSGEETVISFGADSGLPVPDRGETYVFWLEASRETPELRFPGLPSEEAAVCREDLLGTELDLVCEAVDGNSFLLRWKETKGETCRILGQTEDGGDWTLLAELPMGETLCWYTGHLPPYSVCRYRLEAVGGQAGSGAVAPEETEVAAAETLIYAAVWPLEELDLFADPERQEKIGTLSPDRAACILGEEGGSLLVGTPAGSGYVDENYCMIDLPDYVGGLCEYRITNSTASIYYVHGCFLEGMTDTVIPGYEAVALPEGGYLVPLLYPTAQKLIAAALALQEAGYRLRIYDSFRPHIATRYVYDHALEILDEPVSEEEDAPTYRQVMTGDRYSLWDFLAAGISKHNRGIAVDVALVSIADGTEMQMQTPIHDLSWHAATVNNDLNAKMLADYMCAAGFGTLFSEWWHFQDMEALYSLDPPYRSKGVTPEGWRADDVGWRYRCIDGSFLTGESREIDGIWYTFGEDGYLIPTE